MTTTETVASRQGTSTPPHPTLFQPILEKWASHHPLDHTPRSFNPGVAQATLLDWQVKALHTLHLRPLVCHLNLLSRESKLLGETPETRYLTYCREFFSKHVSEFDSCFSELASLRPEVVAQHAKAMAALGRALDSDRALIERRFGIPQTSRVTTIEGSGDTHDGACRVVVLTFDDGSRLVHKPRPVGGEIGWCRLSRWLTANSPFNFPFAKALDRGSYGWAEFIPDLPHDEKAALINDLEFLRRGGRLAAVMHALNAKDMHRDNLRVTRDGPLPLDLETILHSPLPAGSPLSPGDVTAALGSSVSWNGILPTAVPLPNSNGWVDFGFLATEDGGGETVRYLGVRNPFRDDMYLAFDAEDTWEHPYEKRTKEESVAAATAVAEGFEESYRWLMAHRGRFEAAVRACFSTARLRYLNAMTQDYMNTLRLSCSAEAMADSAVRTDRLRRISSFHGDPVPALVEAEINQLRLGHIPLFLMDATSVSVRDAQGRALALVSVSPLMSAEQKIGNLGEDDLNQQLDLIWSAFVALHPDNHLQQAQNSFRTQTTSSVSLAELAHELAEGLTRRALPDGDPDWAPTWLSPVPSADMIRPWAPGPLGFDLYSGRTGVALALAQASVVLHHDGARRVASAVFEACSRSIAHELTPLTDTVGTSLWTGLTGIAAALRRAGLLLERPDWIATANAALATTARPEGLDVIEGSSGWLSGLAAGRVQQPEQAERFLEALRNTNDPDPTLEHSGYAHGAAGVLHALALTELPDHLISHQFGRVLKHLESLRTEDGRNWRVSTFPDSGTATAWCHGAPGIALGLAGAHLARPNLVSTELVDLAVAAMAEDGFGRNLTLCHGDTGTWAIAHWIARHLGHDRAHQLSADGAAVLSAESIKAQLSDRRNRNSLNETLMVGRAGVLLHLTTRLEPSLGSFPLTPELNGES